MVRSLVLDHSDPAVTYSGRWLVLPAVHLTGEHNASATFDFVGSSVSITGSIGIGNEDIPLLSYALDGEDSDFYAFDSEHPHILYSSPPLQEGRHILSLTLLTNTSVLSIESMLITSNDIESGFKPHLSLTTIQIIGITCGALALILIVLLALFIIFRLRKRDIIYNSKGPLQVALPTTKEAFTARNCSTYGLTFLPYEPGSDNFTQLPPKKAQPRLKNHDDVSPMSKEGISAADPGA